MEIIAIIPARGGSKGIPRKNIRQLVDRPLIAYNIQQAQQSNLITRVIVSTDDEEIGAVAERYGAEVLWRPSEISGDHASSESALLHVIETLEAREGYQSDIVVFLQCTSPLTLTEDIDGTIDALIDSHADSALTVAPFHYFLWSDEDNADTDKGAYGLNHDKGVRLLRQEREPQYIETGAVYVMRTAGFLRARHRFFGKTALYIMPNDRRLEIDEPVDFKIAEVLLGEINQKIPNIEKLPNPVHALILDFDGVFTDNKVVVFQDGKEAVLCDRSDGWGIAQLKKTAIPILILSTEKNPVVQARADKLDIPCIHGLDNKWNILEKYLQERDMQPGNIVYVGNDLNDLECMENIGCSVAVADAHPKVKSQAAIILTNVGGDGAVREICDLIIDQQRESNTSSLRGENV